MPSQNEAVIHRFYEAFLPGNTGLLHQVLAPDWIDHTLPPGRAPGLAGLEQALQRLHTLLPDLRTNVLKVVSTEDHVAVHLVFEGTHDGTLFNAAPTHKVIRFIAFDMHHVSGDRIVESWHLEDNLSLLMQIGVIPPLA